MFIKELTAVWNQLPDQYATHRTSTSQRGSTTANPSGLLMHQKLYPYIKKQPPRDDVNATGGNSSRNIS